ncbi:MAG TPA: DNA polymerase III subunit delta', partial [Skermanella sp.]|nr:DNA polymerase III subunit delta' [Skermanella sp.]
MTTEFPDPRHNPDLLAHHAAEQVLLDAWNSGRLPHAWLIGGIPGIGKATLA